MLIFLAGGADLCFALNDAHEYEFLLRDHLGMTTRDFEAFMVFVNLGLVNLFGDFTINHTEWSTFLRSGHFSFKGDRV